MDGVGVTEVAEERGHGREFPGPGRRAETARLEHFPPGDDVGTTDEGELAEAADPEHRHELPDVAPVRAPGVRVVDVGEPLGRRRHVGQLLELRRRDQPAADVAPNRQFSRRCPRACGVQLRYVHARILLPIMYFINSNGSSTPCPLNHSWENSPTQDRPPPWGTKKLRARQRDALRKLVKIRRPPGGGTEAPTSWRRPRPALGGLPKEADGAKIPSTGIFRSPWPGSTCQASRRQFHSRVLKEIMDDRMRSGAVLRNFRKIVTLKLRTRPPVMGDPRWKKFGRSANRLGGLTGWGD